MCIQKFRLFCLQQYLVSDFPVFISTHKFSHSFYLLPCPTGDRGREQLGGCWAARWDHLPQQSTSLQLFTLAFPVFVAICHYRQFAVDFPHNFSLYLYTL